ncbi:MAG: hypothetical protein R6V35_04250 [Candidatus Nanohaloarchaea archaeon]
MVLGTALAIIGIIVVIIGLLAVLGLSSIIPGEAVASGIQGAFTVFFNWWQLWAPLLLIAVVAYIARGGRGGGSSATDTAVGLAEGVTRGVRSDGGDPEPDPVPDDPTPSPSPSDPSDSTDDTGGGGGSTGGGSSGGDNVYMMQQQQQQMMALFGNLISGLSQQQQQMAMQFMQIMNPENVDPSGEGVEIDLDNGSKAVVDSEIYSALVNEVSNAVSQVSKEEMRQMLVEFGNDIETSGGNNNEILMEILQEIRSVESGNTDVTVENTATAGSSSDLESVMAQHNEMVQQILDNQLNGDTGSDQEGNTSVAASLQPFPITEGMNSENIFLVISAESNNTINKLTAGLDGNNTEINYNNHVIEERIPLSRFIGSQQFNKGETHQYIANISAQGDNANVVNQFQVKPRSNKNRETGNSTVSMNNQQISEVEQNMDASVKREIEELQQEYENLTGMIDDTNQLERVESALTNDVEEVVNHLKKARQWEHKLQQHQNGRLENSKVQEQIEHDLHEIQAQISRADDAVKQFKKDSRNMKKIMKKLTTESEEFNNLTRAIAEQEEKLDELDSTLNGVMNDLRDAGISV